MATFFEKLKEAGKVITAANKNPYGEANLPSLDESANKATWQERIAIPFSYKTSDEGDRQYGMVYIPKYESSKFQKWGEVSGGDVDIYGAELTDGMSFTPQGFDSLYQKVKDKDFLWGDLSGITFDKVTHGGKIEVQDTDNFKLLKESLMQAQEDDRKNAKRRRDFYDSYRTYQGKGGA